MNDVHLPTLLDESIPPPPEDVRHAPLPAIRRRAAARRRLTRISFAAGCALVLAATIGALATRTGSGDVDPASSPRRTTMVVSLTASGGGADATVIREAMGAIELRATVSGLTGVSVRAGDGSSIVVSAAGAVDDAVMRELVRKSDFQLRMVIDSYSPSEIGYPYPLTWPTAAPAPVTEPGSQTTLETVRAKLGPAFAVALAIHSPHALPEATLTKLAAFATLTGAEVAVLPPDMQFNVPTISCAQLNARPARPSSSPAATSGRHVACDAYNEAKFLLGPAGVSGDRIRSVIVAPGEGVELVNINFDPNGYAAVAAFTLEAATNAGNVCKASAEGHCAVAFLIDGQVLSAPQIIEPSAGGSLHMSTDLPQPRLLQLAASLTLTGLPVTLSVQSITVGDR